MIAQLVRMVRIHIIMIVFSLNLPEGPAPVVSGKSGPDGYDVSGRITLSPGLPGPGGYGVRTLPGKYASLPGGCPGLPGGYPNPAFPGRAAGRR